MVVGLTIAGVYVKEDGIDVFSGVDSGLNAAFTRCVGEGVLWDGEGVEGP